MLVTSTDAMRSVLRGVLPEQQNPGLYALHRHGEEDAEMARYLKEQLGQALKEQKEEIMAVWKSVRDYIEANAADGRDVLVEGIHILPEFVKDLHGHDCRAVFLGNQSPAHDAAVRLHAKENTTDWIGQHSEGVVSGWIRFAQAFSIYIEKEAQKHSLPYVAMGDGDTFESSVRESIHLLFDV
jgi:2-phosphoglycerate kinase